MPHDHGAFAQRSKVLVPWAIQRGLNPPTVVRGEGCFFIDREGKRYLDLTSGFVAMPLGHGHPKVVEAIRAQAGRLCWTPSSFFNDVRAQYAEALARIAPWSQGSDEGARVHFASGGAEANDDMIKIVRLVTRRPKILCAYRAYHGSTIGASALTGVDRWRDPFPNLPGIVRFFAPYPYRSPFHASTPEEETERALAHLETILSHEGALNVAAIVLEPVTGSSGLVVYPPGYLAGLRALCDKHGILLAFDEVMTGFGRTGKSFAAVRLGVTPDLLSFAKGASGSYVPLGGVLVREKVASFFDREYFDVGHTHAGHVLGVAAGLATLHVFEEEGLFERAITLETWLREGLEALRARHPRIVGDVRGLGALFALELVSDPARKTPLVPWHHAQGSEPMKAFYGELLRQGVHAYGRYNIVLVAPPLTIARHELELGLRALDGALSAASRASSPSSAPVGRVANGGAA
ncbi:aminotransferase class III-fold pyridoxal phosphate-dependent enzyme [Pendulispora albinea]|uniref:Aminotransferase class III-fold pyridoxal phosphate-dependent enzyme n=1 Tax=Pendulispora albinea TaxID=2741071 RepID=A0ABZ2M1A4_9BACT